MPQSHFEEVFTRLRALLKPLEPDLKLKADTASNYDLYSNQVRADGYEYAFGAVVIKKNYVSYHLFPLYACPDLLLGISDALKKRMQGKSCFGFKTVDEGLLAELETLTQKSFVHLQTHGY